MIRNSFSRLLKNSNNTPPKTISEENSKYRILPLLLLYVAGIVHLIYFFNFGSITCLTDDWVKEYEYYSILQKALINHAIPYQISQQIQGTNRFLAIPETNLFPSIILLKYMSTGKFLLLHNILMYSFGFAGCLLIMRKYRLTFLPFAFLFLFFNFNGYITSHLSAGHSMWSGYFLLSIFFYLVFEIIEKVQSTFITLKLSFLLFIILLVGAVHIYIWCLMMLFLIALFRWKYLKTSIYCIAMSLILGLFRLAPASLVFKGEDKYFKMGFDSPLNFINSLVNIFPRFHFVNVYSRAIGWCEYDYYISVVGLLFLLYFGIFYSIYNKSFNPSFKVLIIPSIILTILSFGNIFRLITSQLLPIFRNEQQSSRFIIIPLLFLSIISCIQMQNMIAETNKKYVRLFFYFTLILLAIFLTKHSVLWQVLPFEKYPAYSSLGLNFNIISANDVIYKTVTQISFLISVITIVIISIKMLKYAKRQHL